MFHISLRIFVAIHFAALGGLSLYGFHRLWLLYHWWRERRRPAAPPPQLPEEENLPVVTVQLPLYNERFVAERLLDAVADLRWPRERLDIQVLDDSTDDTGDIVAARAAYWEGEGVTVTVLRRRERSGYKAGALAHGLERARGDLIAVFDADFLPPPDFLLRTIPWFNAPDVGMVQARWGFCNAESSLFTRIQALLLGPHFRIEHWVRSRHHGACVEHHAFRCERGLELRRGFRTDSKIRPQRT